MYISRECCGYTEEGIVHSCKYIWLVDCKPRDLLHAVILDYLFRYLTQRIILSFRAPLQLHYSLLSRMGPDHQSRVFLEP
jgi:hypothetical protein